MHHPAFAMTRGFPLRGITAPVVVSFAIGYGIGMVLNATLLATTTKLLAGDLPESTSRLAQ
jgi:hypothetical protein